MRLALIFTLLASHTHAQSCGGPLVEFIADIREESVAEGISGADVDRFFQGAAIDPEVLQADRSQAVFSARFH